MLNLLRALPIPLPRCVTLALLVLSSICLAPPALAAGATFPGEAGASPASTAASAVPLRLAASAADAPEDATVRIAGVTYLGDLPTHVADWLGLFEKEGVEAVVTFSNAGKVNLERLRAGEVEFALMALTPPVLDLHADATPGGADDPVILASLLHGGPLNQVVTLPDSGLRRVEDLPGRRVGLMRGTNAELVWWLLAVSHGLAPAVADLRDLPIEALGDALLAGEVDAAVLWEPWTSRLAERVTGQINIIPGSDSYVAKWVLVTRRAVVTSQPQRCAAVLRAYRRAIDYLERRPEPALREYARRVDVAPATLVDGTGVTYQYRLNLDWALLSSLQQQMAWARKRTPDARGEARSILQLLAPGPLRTLDPAAVAFPLTGEAPLDEGSGP